MKSIQIFVPRAERKNGRFLGTIVGFRVFGPYLDVYHRKYDGPQEDIKDIPKEKISVTFK